MALFAAVDDDAAAVAAPEWLDEVEATAAPLAVASVSSVHVGDVGERLVWLVDCYDVTSADDNEMW